MALPEISTGYKPEFGLGALYQGFNAGNADMSAQEELLKQFLANQREQQMQPIDVNQAQQNLLASMYKSDPRYQQGMTDMIEGQGYSNLAAGQTARGLQQFKQEAGQAELQNQAAKERLFGNMYRNVEDQYNPQKTDQERTAAGQKGFFLADTLSEVDPLFMQKKKLLEQKGDQALELKELDQAGKEKLAQLKAAAVKGDKTAQEALVHYLSNLLATGRISPDTYATHLADLQNSITAAKIQPGADINTENPAVSKILKPKPAQTTYTPPVIGSQSPQPAQPTAKLSPEDRAALIKKLTQGN